MQSLTYARETLEATPPRAVQLLRGIATSLTIRAHLAGVGFRRADLDEGWELLRDACELVDDELAAPSALDVAAAVAELDAWDERGFMLIEATLTHRYPQQARFLMAGLSASEGPAAVAGVAALLDRLDALDRDPLREEHAEDDHAALEALAQRGITAEERTRLRALVERVAEATRGAAQNTRTEEGSQMARLIRLRRWFDEWAQIARAVLRRPEHLVHLGLASRRAPDTSGGAP
jgi:hypothetical protein